MLDLIRKKQKTIIVKVVFWVIIATFIGTIFLVWGKGRDQQQEVSVAAQVNGMEISFDEFKSTYSNMYNLYRNIYGQGFTPELERQLQLSKQALEMLVNQTLLLQEAERLNIVVEKQELVQAIAAIADFQVDGQFSKDQYLAVLKYQRMTAELFEQMQRRQMLVDKTRRQIQADVVVSDAEVAEEYRRLNEKINLEFLAFPASRYLERVQLDGERVQRYYDENKESFRVADQLSLDYVQLNPATYRSEVTFEEGDLERYYRRHIGNYQIPEQVSVAHILIKVDADADPETVASRQQQASKILEAARAGDFGNLAKEHSQDSATAKNGGLLGYFGRGEMDAAFEEAAFALAAGELSELVRSRFGFHIIKGQGRIEAGFQTLAEVEANVRAGLTAELSERLAYEKAMDAYNLNRKQGSLSAAAQSLNLPVTNSGWFNAGQPIPGIGDVAELGKQATEQAVGQLLAPIKTSGGVFLCAVADKKASHIPELAIVKAQVEEIVRRQAARELADQDAAATLVKVLAGTRMNELAAKGNPVAETGLFSRSLGDFIPKLGSVPDLAQRAFNLTIKQPVAEQVFANGDSFYVVRLKQLQPADPQGLSAEESQRLHDSVLTGKRDEVLRTKLAVLRESAEVTIAPAILRSIEGSL